MRCFDSDGRNAVGVSIYIGCSKTAGINTIRTNDTGNGNT